MAETDSTQSLHWGKALVNGLYANDARFQPLAFKAFCQLALRLAWAKYQNGLCVVNMPDDVIVESVEMSRSMLSLPAPTGSAWRCAF